MKSDTIAAIATAMTPAGIGIIRISGEDAFKIIDKIYKSKFILSFQCVWYTIIKVKIKKLLHN